MAAHVETQLPASFLRLPSELRLHIYSYLGPTNVSQGVQIDLNNSYVTTPASSAQALASLSQTCRMVRAEVTDLLDAMRTATVLLGHETPEYFVALPHHLTFRQWHKVDPGLEYLEHMRTIELFIGIDLHYSTGAEDLEERWKRQLRMLSKCEDVLCMLNSSSELERLSLNVYVEPTRRFEGLIPIGRQLMELVAAIEAEDGDTGRNTKDHELAFAMVAVAILRQGTSNPWLLEIWP